MEITPYIQHTHLVEVEDMNEIYSKIKQTLDEVAGKWEKMEDHKERVGSMNTIR
jgi:hypothetical protein